MMSPRSTSKSSSHVKSQQYQVKSEVGGGKEMVVEEVVGKKGGWMNESGEVAFITPGPCPQPMGDMDLLRIAHDLECMDLFRVYRRKAQCEYYSLMHRISLYYTIYITMRYHEVI
jgi:hypothetical protein